MPSPSTPWNDQYRTLAEAMAGQMKEIGIDASIRFWEYSVVKPMLLGWRAHGLRWGAGATRPLIRSATLRRSGIAMIPRLESYGRGNFSTYSNERVDELIKAAETIPDAAERQKLYDEAQEIVYEEAPAIFLVLPEEAEAARADITNWEPASDSRINMHDVCITP